VAVELGNLDDLVNGQMRRVECGGALADESTDAIVVCRVAGVLYALTDNCSHANARLSDGRLRGTTVTCPLHGAQFDVRDGRRGGPPASRDVACHVVVERDSAASVALPGESELGE
jgi:nitrite reductase/ring-hydroxylating ferredoxin subunit